MVAVDFKWLLLTCGLDLFHTTDAEGGDNDDPENPLAERAPAGEAEEEEEPDAAESKEEAKEEALEDEDGDRENPQDDIEQLAEEVSTMTVHSKATGGHSLAFFFPYIMHKCVEVNFVVIAIDFLVVGMSRDMCKPRIKEGNEKVLQLGFEIPHYFADTGRVVRANRVYDEDFTDDDHKEASFTAEASKITNPLPRGEPIQSAPMEISLPLRLKKRLSIGHSSTLTIHMLTSLRT